jgi:hypothetical protein
MARLDDIYGNREQETADDRIREYEFWKFFSTLHAQKHPQLQTGMAGDESDNGHRARVNGFIVLTLGAVILGGLGIMLLHDLGYLG